MGRTLQVAARRVDDPDQTVLGVEFARSKTVRNPVGVRGAKLLFMMIGHAGSGMAADGWHVMDGRAIRQFAQRGLGHLSVDAMRAAMHELMAMYLEFWVYDRDSKRSSYRMGQILEEAIVEVDEREGSRRTLLLRWKFGALFRKLASRSDYWTVIANRDVMRLRTRYAIDLYRYLMSYASIGDSGLRVELEVLRGVMGVNGKSYAQFKEFHKYVLAPSIKMIGEEIGWEVPYQLIRRGRRVTEIAFSWGTRGVPGRADVAGTVVKRVGGTGPFPGDGVIRDTVWEAVAAEYVRGLDTDEVGRRYVAWCSRKGIPLDDRATAGRFRSFCDTLGRSGEGSRPDEGGEPGRVRTGDLWPAEEFPESGEIRFELGWKALAEEHGKGCDPNAIGRDFVRYCDEAGIPLGSKGVKDEFVRFCREGL